MAHSPAWSAFRAVFIILTVVSYIIVVFSLPSNLSGLWYSYIFAVSWSTARLMFSATNTRLIAKCHCRLNRPKQNFFVTLNAGLSIFDIVVQVAVPISIALDDGLASVSAFMLALSFASIGLDLAYLNQFANEARKLRRQEDSGGYISTNSNEM